MLGGEGRGLISSLNFPHVTSLMFPLSVFALNKVLRETMIFLIRKRKVSLTFNSESV